MCKKRAYPIDANTLPLTATSTAFEKGIKQVGNVFDPAISQLRDVAAGLQVIYERLGKFPVSQIGTNALKDITTGLTNVMEPFLYRNFYIVASTPWPRCKLEQIIDFDETLSYYDGDRRKLEIHIELAKCMLLLLRKKGTGDQFFLNGKSSDMDEYLDEATIRFCDIMRRARIVGEELSSARKLLIQLRPVNLTNVHVG